jgi:uncharacterized protein YndB with AHSA1/START domain
MTATSGRRGNVSQPTGEQLLITREFDAPKQLVYRAYTTPELVKRWWPARRFEMPLCDIDCGSAVAGSMQGATTMASKRRSTRVSRNRAEPAHRLDRGLRGHPVCGGRV